MSPRNNSDRLRIQWICELIHCSFKYSFITYEYIANVYGITKEEYDYLYKIVKENDKEYDNTQIKPSKNIAMFEK